MKTFVCFVLTILCFVIDVLPLYAVSDKDFCFKRYNTNDNLTSNRITAISQDLDGRIWIGTDNGITCFHGGVISKMYPSPYTILPSYITSICTTDTTQLLVGTEKGVFILDIEVNRISSIDVSQDYEKAYDLLCSSFINNIVSDSDGNYWISTISNGVFLYNKRMASLSHYSLDTSRNTSNFIVIDSKGNIWTGDFSSLYFFSNKDNKFVRFNYNKNIHTTFLYSDKDYIWIGTWRSGLLRMDINTGEIITCLYPDHINRIYNIHSILRYDNENLLIGTDNGLITYNDKTGETVYTQSDNYNNFNLSDKFVYSIFKDSEGGIWLGTYYNGLNYLSPYNRFFGKYTRYNYDNLNGNVIGKFCEDRNGNIWIGSDDGGLSLYIPEQNSFSTYLDRYDVGFLNVQSLMANDDDIWIGTYGDGLNKINLRTGKKTVYLSNKNDSTSIDNNSVYSIYKSKSGCIWIGTMSGICIYNLKNDGFKRIKNLTEAVTDIKEDNIGNIWFCTSGRSIIRYNQKDLSWNDLRLDSLKSNINTLYIDGENTVWIGTSNGLYYLKQPNNAINRCDVLSGNNIKTITEHKNSLIISTSKGIIKYNKSNEKYEIFSLNDGLQSVNFNVGSVLNTRNGCVYFGSNNGFNSFYPEHLPRCNVNASIALIDLEIHNKPVNVDHSYILDKALNYTNKIELEYEDNFFGILYSALNYGNLEHYNYAYMLEGFEKEWNYVGKSTKAVYTNIPPGEYKFKVRTYRNGILNDNEKSIDISVLPPFYLTVPFKVLYVIIVICAVSVFIRLTLKRKETKHRLEISAIKENKEKEIQNAKIKFFTMIAHEIRTPLSLIIGPVEKLMECKDNIDKDVYDELQVVDRNSQRLLDLVNQLLDFRKIEQKELCLHLTKENLVDIVEGVGNRFIPMLKGKNIRLSLEMPEQPVFCDIDKEGFTKIISNLLTNACKYTKNLINVKLEIVDNNSKVSLTVSDNGCGIPEEDVENIFTPFYQASNNKPGTGIGLSIVKDIVNAHKGHVFVESEVNNGARFTVLIPIYNTEYNKGEGLDTEKFPEDIIEETSSHNDTRTNILIVEDNSDMMEFLSKHLGRKYNVLAAEDGVEALKLLGEQEISVVVSDWMMPNMDGVELCKNIRNNNMTSHIPIIILTAKTDDYSKTYGMNCGADAYIEKPFSLKYLEACIDNLLEIRSQLRTKFSKMPMVPISTIASNTNDEALLNKMTQIIEDNMSNPDLSVDFIASKLGISRSGMYTKIRGLADVTPNEMIQIIRMKKAAELILLNKYRINEISYMVGFNNTSYFSRCFQKQFGVKPGEFFDSQKK